MYAGSTRYHYAKDSAGGQTTGQGSGGKWWVDGKPIKTPAGSSATASKTSG